MPHSLERASTCSRRCIPSQALPRLPALAASIVTTRDDWRGGRKKSSIISARPAGLEPATRGLEVTLESSAPGSSGSQPFGIVRGRRTTSVQPFGPDLHEWRALLSPEVASDRVMLHPPAPLEIARRRLRFVTDWSDREHSE
jgi:hypothetical protein